MTEAIWQGKTLTKSYGPNQFSLNNASLDIKAGEITGVVGENGNGKTTLLRIIAGELDIDQGEMNAFGHIIKPELWRSIKEQISYIPQRIPRWYGYLRTNLEFQAASHGVPANEIEPKINLLLEKLGLTKYSHLKWTEISTGYRLRFQLAKMLITNPKLIILDEPIANLDINAQEKFLSDLRDLVNHQEFQTAVILSSQQLHQVEAFSDNIVFIKNGKIEYSGKVNEVGNSRTTNLFEISTSISKSDLIAILKDNGKITGEKGKAYQIETELNYSAELLLTDIIQNNGAISYFRDISSSTKKLFN